MKFATSKEKEKRSSAPQKRKEKKKFTTSKKERKEEVDHLKLLFDVARHIAFPLQLSLPLVDHCCQLLLIKFIILLNSLFSFIQL